MAIWRNNFFSQQIFPGFYARKANKRIKKYNENLGEATVEDVHKPSVVLALLKIDIENQGERKKGLEDKVKAILFSISISITAITFSLTYGKTGIGSIADIIAITLLVVSIYYFISCAAVSVETLMPIQFQLIQTLSEFDDKKNTITLTTETELEQYKRLMVAKFQNDSSNLQVANLTYAALTLLRNGIILFSLYFVGALIAKNVPNKFTDKVLITNKKVIKINDTVNVILPYSYEAEADNSSVPLKIGNIEVKVIKISKIQRDTTKRNTKANNLNHKGEKNKAP